VLKNRWVQLAFGVLCTVALSNMQYGWTLFVNPMQAATHWERASIQVAFTIMIFVNTWLSPVEGWIVDRYGPRPVVMFGGLMTGLSWVLNSRAESLQALYLAAVVGGIGVGCVFATCMGVALKWFPDRRGLASGLIAAGLALGAALTVIPVAAMIKSSGYRHTFLFFGLIQGTTIFVLGLFLLRPIVPKSWYEAAARAGFQRVGFQRQADFAPSQTVRTGTFWLIYLVYVLIASGGMAITAQLGPIAHDFGVEDQLVRLLGYSIPVLTLAITVDNFANGITRPLCGFISDKIGRENAMLLIFSAESVAFVGMAVFGHRPLLFVLFAALIFLFWGEVFSIFPAICGDTFGVKNATANNGLLYTAKGTSALVVPLANVLATATGTWMSVLLTAAVLSMLSGLLAKFVLAPMRRKILNSEPSPWQGGGAPPAPQPASKER
jgi:OFA family oxalate/formate antiporter-like MFS transporter